MKYFLANIFRFSLLGIISLMILVSIYLILDPFKVVRSYNTFYNLKDKGRVGLNKDYVSTSTLLKNYRVHHYNSFIFGNSRSIFYQVSDWKKHLPQNSNAYHFDGSDEALYALHKKIEYLDKKGIEIKNVLLILDSATLSQDKPKSGHLFMLSPALINNSNIIDFHMTYFKAFLTPRFLFAFVDYKISNVVKPYMKKGQMLDDRPMNYDKQLNEIRFDHFEELIKQNKYYSTDRLAVFYKRDSLEHSYPELIRENQKIILSSIYNILIKHGSNYKIVISPLYDQKKLNRNDLQYLIRLFGEDNVFDYSGINKYTDNFKNYYESSHYRPHVARGILDEIYNPKYPVDTQ